MAVSKTSAGILPFRRTAEGELEVLIGHMGGPFWAKKDERAWSIFKGEYDPGAEEPRAAATREFAEETGRSLPPDARFVELGEIKQRAGKTVVAWAVDAPQLDPAGFESNTFEVEWPPRSGRMQSFPEVDRASWLPIAEAEPKLVAAQAEFLGRLAERV
ncbi:MAG: NUDIX domain-containing protein [Solirubrobacteraceae bacterium]|nr:NUDIX domain-containing protein [Solirubrobacteraceae bacterium]